MKNPVFEKYREHVGHKIEVVVYGLHTDSGVDNVAIECIDCYCTLTDESPEVEGELYAKS